jgi:mevalonate kinase
MVDINELTTATLAVAEVCSSTTDYICSAFDSYKKLPREIRSIINDLNSLHTSLLQLDTVLRAVHSSSSLNKSTTRSTKRLVDRCQQTFSQLVQLFGQDDQQEAEHYLDESDMDKAKEFLEVARKLKQHNDDLGALIVGLGR